MQRVEKVVWGFLLIGTGYIDLFQDRESESRVPVCETEAGLITSYWSHGSNNNTALHPLTTLKMPSNRTLFNTHCSENYLSFIKAQYIKT